MTINTIRKANEIYNRIEDAYKTHSDIPQSDFQGILEAIIIDALNWKGGEGGGAE